MNQREEVACIVVGNEIITATYPGDKKLETGTQPEEEKIYRCSQEELDAIHRAYDEELEGKWRRGAEVRYWEDVTEGEELNPIVKGPLDIVDAAAFGWLISMNFLGAFAVKWKYIKNNLDRCTVDPETGEYQLPIAWHFSDKIAREMGLARAQSFGAHNEASLAHIISNWMGDDGFVKRLEVQHRAVKYFGDISRIKGRVTRKYIEDNEHAQTIINQTLDWYNNTIFNLDNLDSAERIIEENWTGGRFISEQIISDG